jgi:CubicO group peptidase (beta-lactamase class C family)
MPEDGLSRRAALTGAALGLAAPGPAQAAAAAVAAGSVADALKELDRLAEDAMSRTGVPGLAIAVVHKDAMVYSKGFGRR